MQKPLWFKINRKEFNELKGDIYNNQDNNDFKLKINKKTYDLESPQKFWTEVTTRKITKSEAKELYNELIQKGFDTLEKLNSNKPEKYNILNILESVGTIFTGSYLHYKDVPKETMFERSITERIKSRKGRLDEIERKKQNIKNELFKEYFTDYQIPSNVYKNSIEIENAETNKTKVDFIKKIISKLQKTVDYVPKDNTFKIEENQKIIEIVKRILEFNDKIQSRQGIKILTPNQMLGRLLISLAQLKAGNNSEKFKKEIRQSLYSLYRSKELTKNAYKSLVDII